MSSAPHILIVDRLPERAAEVAKTLAERGYVTTQREGFVPQTPPPEPPPVLICADRPATNSAVDSCRRFRQCYPDAPVLAYGNEVREVLRLRFMEAGAFDLVTADRIPAAVAAHVPAPKADAGDAAPAEDADAMFIKLGPGELPNTIQFLTMSPRDGELVVDFASARMRGYLYLEEGHLVHARYAGSDGIEAFAVMVAEGGGEARFYEGRRTSRRTIDKTVSQLLIEASVLADELATIAESISTDAVPKIRELGSLDLDRNGAAILKQVDGVLSARQIIEQLKMTELVGSLTFAALLEAGAVEF